jgi:hypothetical protein
MKNVKLFQEQINQTQKFEIDSLEKFNLNLIDLSDKLENQNSNSKIIEENEKKLKIIETKFKDQEDSFNDADNKNKK